VTSAGAVFYITSGIHAQVCFNCHSPTMQHVIIIKCAGEKEI